MTVTLRLEKQPSVLLSRISTVTPAVKYDISNRRSDEDPIRVETCSLLSIIKTDVFDILFILFFAITVIHRDV